jgi:hypothetical protein
MSFMTRFLIVTTSLVSGLFLLFLACKLYPEVVAAVVIGAALIFMSYIVTLAWEQENEP